MLKNQFYHPTVEKYFKYCRPHYVELLSAMNLDVVYEKAEGDRLWYSKNGETFEVVDFAGGFGSTLFGHNHPVLVDEAKRLHDQQVPIMVQASCREGAANLAERLNNMVGAGDFVTLFTNSGAETVEAAMKHAHLEKGRSVYWAISGAFHGKTLGAIQLTSSYCEPYRGMGPEVRFLEPTNMQNWEQAKSQDASNVAAIFIEPIQGEGGVKSLPDKLIKWLNQTSQELDIPIIADEIQTGMGRSGTFLKSFDIGLNADYICLGKSLGGGLTKIGALMIRRERFVEEFAITHTSTFAEDDYSCKIALKALDILDTDELVSVCKTKGQLFISKLKELQEAYPDQIKEVRGTGLIIGLELADQSASLSNILKMLSQGKYLGWAAAAYLLNSHNIRVAPTLNQSLTLRIEPSAYISEEDIEYFVNAVRMLCETLKLSDGGHLISNQMNSHPQQVSDWRHKQSSRLVKPRGNQQVAFIGHFLSVSDLISCDPSLSPFSECILSEYLDHSAAIVQPTVIESMNIKSVTGESVHLRFIGLMLTARQIEHHKRANNISWIQKKIDSAVKLARDLGCQIVGLGGYTSSITGNCLRIGTKNIALTSGNSLTVGAAFKALEKTANLRGMDMAGSRAAVVGLPGNIASMAALLLAPYASELTLVQRTSDSGRTKQLVDLIKTEYPNTRINLTTDLNSLRNASLILSASSSSEEIIWPQHLNMEKVIVCDIAVPSDVSDSVLLERPNTTIVNGGIIQLPKNKKFSIAGVPLEKGRVYACMAETLLMGLENITEHYSYGRINKEGLDQIMKIADKHGFVVEPVQRKMSKVQA